MRSFAAVTYDLLLLNLGLSKGTQKRPNPWQNGDGKPLVELKLDTWIAEGRSACLHPGSPVFLFSLLNEKA